MKRITAQFIPNFKRLNVLAVVISYSPYDNLRPVLTRHACVDLKYKQLNLSSVITGLTFVNYKWNVIRPTICLYVQHMGQYKFMCTDYWPLSINVHTLVIYLNYDYN